MSDACLHYEDGDGTCLLNACNVCFEEIGRLRDERADAIADLAEAERLRDLHWREVESLREWKDKLEAEAERLAGLVQGWYEGRARIGAHVTFVDQRFYDSVRCERTGWPGDDEHGDGGPPEE